MSKEEAPVVYSIILTGYCEFLIDNKEYEKARSLVMEAIKSSKYTQLDEYNVKFLRILSELEEKEHFSIKGCLWIVTLLLLVFVFCKWTRRQMAADEQGVEYKDNGPMERMVNLCPNRVMEMICC